MIDILKQAYAPMKKGRLRVIIKGKGETNVVEMDTLSPIGKRIGKICVDALMKEGDRLMQEAIAGKR